MKRAAGLLQSRPRRRLRCHIACIASHRIASHTPHSSSSPLREGRLIYACYASYACYATRVVRSHQVTTPRAGHSEKGGAGNGAGAGADGGPLGSMEERSDSMHVEVPLLHSIA